MEDLIQKTIDQCEYNRALLQEAYDIIQGLKTLLEQKDKVIEAYRKTVVAHSL